MRIILVVLGLISSLFTLLSQELNLYERYYINPFIVNPAATGAEYYPVATISYRKQWLGFKDAPNTLFVAGNYRIGNYDFYNPKKFINKGPLQLKDRVALGVSICRDNDGPLSYTGGIIAYAYHLPVGAKSQLSFGISTLLGMHSINNAILEPGQMNDTYLFNGMENEFRANVNTGVLYYNNTYFIGLSVNKILRDIRNVNGQEIFEPSYFIMGGYKFWKANNTFTLEPSVTLKKISNLNTMVDLHAKLYIKKFNWIALSYGTAGNMDFQFCLRLYKMVYAGYNFESSFGRINSYNFGSHEISIGINMGLRAVEGIRETVN